MKKSFVLTSIMMITFLGLMLFSCSKNTTEVASVDFQKMHYADGSRLHRENNIGNAREGDVKHIILRITFGRPRTFPDCTQFGACRVRWFFCEKDGVEVPCTGGTFEHGVFEGNPIYDSSTDSYYVEILFTESVEGTPAEQLNFLAQSDWVLDTESRYGFNLILREGVYGYDSSLGEFGGVKVYFEKD